MIIENKKDVNNILIIIKILRKNLYHLHIKKYNITDIKDTVKNKILEYDNLKLSMINIDNFIENMNEEDFINFIKEELLFFSKIYFRNHFIPNNWYYMDNYQD